MITKEQKNWLSTFVDNVFSTERKQDETFISFYEKLYKAYVKQVQIIFDNEEDNQLFSDIESIHDKVFSYIKQLLTGDFVSIHQSMSQWWFARNSNKAKIVSVNQGSIFYRIRTKEKGKTFKSTDMGYVPFKLRHILNNYRYSINGTPCLYIGKTVLGCWEELRRPSTDCVYATKVTILKDINLLDLRLYPNVKTIEELKNFIVLFPLILACSVKVMTESDSNVFKSEYVIPQLLMQSIMKKNNEGHSYYDGVLYNSTQMDENNPYKDRSLYENIAIPIRSKISNGKIVDLMDSYFSFSDPVNIGYERLLHRIVEPENMTYEGSIWGQTENILINNQ